MYIYIFICLYIYKKREIVDIYIDVGLNVYIIYQSG